MCYRFPKDFTMRNKWIHAIRRAGWNPSDSSVLCSSHFAKESYQRPPGLKQRPILWPHAVPTIFPEHPTHLQPVSILHLHLGAKHHCHKCLLNAKHPSIHHVLTFTL